ncbi:MAG: pseudouridine synthase [Flavobacteriales bacterium]|nr:pseudouridine synthase [Flavobacteriales bacterium]
MTDRTDRSKKGGKKGPARSARPASGTERPRSSRAGKRPPAAERDGYDGPKRSGPSSGPRKRTDRPDSERSTSNSGSRPGSASGTGYGRSTGNDRPFAKGSSRPSGGSRAPFGRASRPGADDRRTKEDGPQSGPRTERGTGRGQGARPGGTGRFSERPTRDGERGPRREGNPERRGERPGGGRPGARTGSGGRYSERPVREGDGGVEGRTERGPRSAGGDASRYTGRGPKPYIKRTERKGPQRSKRSVGTGGEPAPEGLMRLNRYLSQSGVASRREADELIKAGVVSVNGVIVTELGTKVYPADKVHYGGQRLSMEKHRYVLLNKPKDFITTTDDPNDRRTVMHLIAQACTERLYPVGRLDRHTTGVLLMTNDGDLAKKLTHPSHGAEKIYHATLDKSVTKAHLNQLVEGLELEDGFAQADEASYVDGASKKDIGLKIHMGKNRIVRRMFASLGYDVVKLDRVIFAGLTKKDIPRGKWRHLTEKEILFLKKRK